MTCTGPCNVISKTGYFEVNLFMKDNFYLSNNHVVESSIFVETQFVEMGCLVQYNRQAWLVKG